MAEKKTLWAVYTNSDLTEGRGRQFVKHFCEVRATAERLAVGGYVQGTKCPVKPIEALVVEGKHFLPASIINIVPPSVDDEAAQRRMDMRELAIEKAKSLGLSDEEIQSIMKGGDK